MPRIPDANKMGKEWEEYVSSAYNGRRSKSSGANPFDRGDVVIEIKDAEFKTECKSTKFRSFNLKLDTWEKIVKEAHESGSRPGMFIRFMNPDTGETTDLVVRMLDDDLEILDAT